MCKISEPSVSFSDEEFNEILQKKGKEQFDHTKKKLDENTSKGFALLRKLLEVKKESAVVLLDCLFSNAKTSSKYFLGGYVFVTSVNNKDFVTNAKNLLNEAVQKQYPNGLIQNVIRIKDVLAWIKAYEGNLEKAYDDFEKVHNKYPNDTDALFGMAFCREWLLDYKEAIRIFNEYEKLIQKDPSQFNQNAFWHKGFCHIQLNQLEEAKKSFKKFFDASSDGDPLRIEGINYLGYTAAETDDLDLADRYFDRVLDKDNFNFGATIGKNLVKQKRSLEENKKKLIVSTQEHLKKLFTEVPKGLRNVANMYIIQFGIGVFFIIVAIVLAALGIDILISGISGLAGVAISIVSLVNKAPVDLQRNRVNSAQWMIAYYNWINALYMVNLATENLAKNNKETTWKETQPLQDYLTELTTHTIKTMSTYCVIPEEAEKIIKRFEKKLAEKVDKIAKRFEKKLATESSTDSTKEVKSSK